MKNSVSFNSDLAKFGIGVFETIKVLDYPIDLDKHIKRMTRSICELKIKSDLKEEQIQEIILDYIKKNKIKEKAIRITVFDEGYSISVREIIYTKEKYEKGVSLNISPIIRGNSILYKHKTTNYFENIYTKQNANENGFFDGIFINTQGEILETSMSNIYFVKENMIVTPKSEQPILKGIMRSNIKNICNKLDIEYREDIILLKDINTFDFCFISNSLMGVMRVNSINNVIYSKNNKNFLKIFNEVLDMEN